MKRIASQATLVACLTLLGACQTLTLQPKSPLNAMDVTMTSYREANLDRYVLVIMTDAYIRNWFAASASIARESCRRSTRDFLEIFPEPMD